MSRFADPRLHPRTASAMAQTWLKLIEADLIQPASTAPPAAPQFEPADEDSETQPSDHRASTTTSYAFARFDDCGRPVTWPTTDPITVALDPEGMADGQFVTDAYDAFKRINLAGGLKLRLIGHDGSRLDEADITIRWVRKRSELHDGATGQSIATTEVATQHIGEHIVIVSAEIRLLAKKSVPAGFVSGGWGPILLHELLHALGAGHCSDKRQVMYGQSGHTADLGAGDRYLLRMLAEVAMEYEENGESDS